MEKVDDDILLKSLEDLYREYQNNLSELKEICNTITSSKDKAEKNKEEKAKKEEVS